MKTGQALVEMVVAMAIVAMALVGIVGLATKSLSNSTFTKNQTLATNYANQIMECVRNNRNTKDWSAFLTSHNSGCNLPMASGFTASSPGSGTNPFTVIVTVAWSDKIGPHYATQTQRFYPY